VNRPWNETEEDLAREDAARLFLETKWKCVIQKLQPGVYKVDWALFRRAARDTRILAGWGEYKFRENYNWGAFDQIMLSVGKWITLRQLAEKTIQPFFFITEWKDGTIASINWPPHSGAGYPIVLSGNKRGQEGDIEPVIMIPIKEFKVLRGETK